MPIFNWLQDAFDLSRNDYDRLGHFAQGFIPALIIREVLIRINVTKTSIWLFYIVVSMCLEISAEEIRSVKGPWATLILRNYTGILKQTFKYKLQDKKYENSY